MLGKNSGQNAGETENTKLLGRRATEWFVYAVSETGAGERNLLRMTRAAKTSTNLCVASQRRRLWKEGFLVLNPGRPFLLFFGTCDREGNLFNGF